MRSDRMKKGFERAPNRSLLKASGFTDEEISRPIIGIANSWNEIVPGHIHLKDVADAVKDAKKPSKDAVDIAKIIKESKWLPECLSKCQGKFANDENHGGQCEGVKHMTVWRLCNLACWEAEREKLCIF